MGERRGTRGLELWCKRMTEGYPGVKVENMTTSWRDGLAFCAIIHHFRPDLIDFSKLNKNDIYNNNNLAFRIAEDHLGIPALLEPEDMVEYAVPDRLSILTYLSQFYQVFAVNSNSNTKLPSKRPPPSDLQRHMVAATGSSPPKKAALGVLGARKEPCAKCGLPVFIAERLNVRKTLYHRTCFRCAKCDIQLTLHNYTETESGKFCCKICPEEEKSAEMSVLTRSLSDEEKSASLKGDSDPYSDNFENVLEDARDGSLKRSFTLDRMLGTSFVKARSDFMATQMTAFDSDLDTESEEKPPDLPVSPRPQLDDDAQKHSENILSSNSLPNLSDNLSVDSDQKPCISRDRVTKDSVSTEDISVKPSIRSRVKLFEAAIKDCAKTDVNSESREENDNSEGVHQVLSPEDESIGGSSLSIDEKVKEDSSPNDSVVTNLEHSKAHSSNLSVSSKISDEVINEEIIILSSETSYQPQSNEDSVIVISDTEDPKCQTSVQTSDNSNVENEQPKSVTEYPDDLNPFGDEEETEHQKQPLPEAERSVSLNPFGDTDEEEEEEPSNRPLTDSKSLNPFGSDEDEENDEKCSSLPPQPALRRLAAPKMSLSPFWDEEDVYGKSSFETWEDESGGAIEQSSLPPQPARRKLKAPKISLTPYWDEENSPSQASSTYSSPSLSRADKSSLHGSGRKKKPAPKPPIVLQSPSPKEPPKSRKTRRAPPPPTSTPMRVSDSSHLPTVSPIGQGTNTEQMQGNRNESDKNQQHNSSPSDSTKRLMTATEIDHDLELIEVQLRGLEKNGVQLEKIIREKTEIPGANPDDTLAPEIEDMILQLFELINDKHELFRKQTELMYLRRQNRLEKEQADVENQLRCLMLQSDAHKTDRAKAREEKLLNKLLEIVEKRNEIVERLDVERRRQAEEDISIRSEMSLYSMKRKGEHSSLKKTKKDKHKSEKEKSSKKNKGSADKDADDSVKLTPKDKKKKKILNIF